MNPHLRYALSDGPAIAELTPFRGANTFDNARLADEILELGQSGIEGGSSEDSIHEVQSVSIRIRTGKLGKGAKLDFRFLP
ncbi:hypothetical protein [uncultured Thiohalocapsa sp.]|uniref:hypothetical protein n=1 Tax=uncultured Thiohalocapsa sp. TaxID=768990 RepID=UPI0025D1841A|nr:hypothetical protein [uncultured Thiohalocapsa sp.]